MTSREYISASLGQILSAGQIDFIIERSGIGSDMVEFEKIDTAIYETLPFIIPFLNSVSEGGVSVSYDKEALRLYYSLLAKRLGREDELLSMDSSITDRTNDW